MSRWCIVLSVAHSGDEKNTNVALVCISSCAGMLFHPLSSADVDTYVIVKYRVPSMLALAIFNDKNYDMVLCKEIIYR